MKLLWRFLKQYKKLLFFALGLAAINQLFSLMDPQLFRIIVDDYASRFQELSRTEFFRGVSILLLASVGVAMVSRIAKNFQDYFVNVITQRLGTRLYSHSVQHSFSLPYGIFEDQRSGELLLKLQKARTDSQALVISAINVMFFSLVGIIFVIIYAFIVHWLVGLVYFLAIPILGFATFLISRKIKTAQSRVVKETASLAGSTTETLRNVELVKSLGLEGQEIERLNNVNNKILELELRKVRIVRMFSFIQGTLINGLRSVLLLLMLWLIFNQNITIGQFFSLFVYSFFIFSPLAELGSVATNYQEARASLEQLEKILNIKPEAKPAQAKDPGLVREIKYQDVDFSYGDRAKPSLRNISVSIPAGQTVAFVGPSGSGKSTIIKLLAGLYRPSSGQILLNGLNIDEIDKEKFRKRIGLVAQETQLFAGTIRENLLFVNPQATDADCLAALKSAAALQIIERGDGKALDTRIGEGGIKLSGGERQRLAIARALLRQPDLIVFDEATSSLDSLTEKSITETIQTIVKSCPNLISILVAHRLSTVAHADMIYVLERGRIIEQGNHQTLLARAGLYAALWREQSAVNGVPHDLTSVMLSENLQVN